MMTIYVEFILETLLRMIKFSGFNIREFISGFQLYKLSLQDKPAFKFEPKIAVKYTAYWEYGYAVQRLYAHEF